MTANQINYAKYLEDVRSHKASEDINRRQAAAAESQAATAAVNAETNRINAETNKQNSLINESAVGAQWYGAQANKAYQEAMANVSRAQAVETARHNEQGERNTLLIEGWNATNKQTEIESRERIASEDRKTEWDKAILNAFVQGGGKVLDAGINLAGQVGKLLIGGLG